MQRDRHLRGDGWRHHDGQRHIHADNSDLRAAIDTLRGVNGLAPFGWTDATLIVGSAVVKAVHVSELRTALDQTYQAAGRPPPTYGDPTLTAGETVVKAEHVTQVRDAVRALE